MKHSVNVDLPRATNQPEIIKPETVRLAVQAGRGVGLNRGSVWWAHRGLIGEAQAILEEIKTHHSSYYIDHSIAPAPIHITPGFTDDLFPVDEATRFYNRTRHQYPDSPVGLFFGPNSGHMRGMSKPDALSLIHI